MQFDFDTTHSLITKEDILSKVSEEAIFKYYLGVTPSKKLIVSKFRNDNNPTCSFYRKNKYLYLHDFATGEFINCFSCVQKLFNISFTEAIKKIADDFGLTKLGPTNYIAQIANFSTPKLDTKKETLIEVEVKDFSDSELNWWRSFGVYKKTLQKFQVVSCKTVFLNKQIIAQAKDKDYIFGYYGGIVNKIPAWRIYYPKRKNYRFLSNWKANHIQGYDQLAKTGNLLVITKSLKDVMALWAYKINAIAPTSENLFIPDKMLEELKTRFKRIVVFYDNDLPGVSGLNKIKKLHPELLYFFIPRKLGAKDFSDLRKKYGFHNTKKIITKFLKKIK